MDRVFDCIVVGGGHGGCEAAAALAGLGHETLLITGNVDRIGHLSCNPAIGGLAKSHMVREIDALGGHMGLWADAAGIQFRVLNMSKGPAVRATRGQMDREAYMRAVKKTLFSLPHLLIWQDQVTGVRTDDKGATGVLTRQGMEFSARNVLLTTGTFLNGKIHIGLISMPAGRLGDAPAIGLSQSLTSEAHAIIREGFDRSPLFTGIIKGTGARYCPSIEDKVARFPDRDRHHVFLEPEGLDSPEVYCNGISTSLPLDIQERMIHAIKGLEHAVMVRPGYAIEYDYADPTQLRKTFETRAVPHLWFAGQINGTSGYEEAAAQGMWAALNISCSLRGLPPFCPRRDEAYMAVLADDLVTRGTREPYRMFTSRAEHRLLLREDNADMRLTPEGRRLGLVDDARWEAFLKRREAVGRGTEYLEATHIASRENGAAGDLAGRTLAEALRRPDVELDDLENLDPGLSGQLPADSFTRLTIQSDVKYAGYMARQREMVRRTLRLEETRLPDSLDYTKIPGLSAEIVEKLTSVRPASLGQAGRISGVTPAAVDCLEIYLHKLGLLRLRKRRDGAAENGDC